jgi:hypothetical protein
LLLLQIRAGTDNDPFSQNWWEAGSAIDRSHEFAEFGQPRVVDMFDVLEGYVNERH